MSTLYVSDLDGTLLQPDAKLSDETVALLNDAIEKGKLFTIATARTPATVSTILSRVHLRIPAIVMTGAALWDSNTGRYSDVKFMPRESVGQLIEIYRRIGCPTFIYTLVDEKLCIYHDGPMWSAEEAFVAERIGNPYKRLRVDLPLPPEEEMDKVVLFYAIQPDAISRAVYEATAGVKGTRPQFYHDFYGPEIGIVEQFSAEATKALAMRALARRLGAEKIVAFGDNINDLPMMAEADLGVAVENALPEVREAAGLVIGYNTQDAVARFIHNHPGL